MTTKNVKVIEPTVPHIRDSRIIRAAAYCRVSTDSADQINSFSAQLKYYTDYIRSNTAMEFVDIYADEGITGTSIQKREEFKRMMRDAENGKLDRILVKSVSRFARNSLECLENIRQLTSYGTSVLFENDNIDTKTMNSELVLYVKSAFAESEALSGSKRVSTAIRMKMETGEFVTCCAPFGYRLDREKHLIVVPHEADIVKRIYNLYLSGTGLAGIAEMLNTEKVPNPSGIWKSQGIHYILTNEKYIGDSLCQKNYTPQILPFKKEKNRGERNKYYINNSHEAIIEKDIFETVRKRLQRNPSFSNFIPKQNHWQDKVKCADCGWHYKRIQNKDKRYLVCSRKSVSGKSCLGMNIREDILINAFVYMYNKLRRFQNEILNKPISELIHLREMITGQNNEISQIDTEIAELCAMNNTYTDFYSKGIIDDVSYYERTSELKFKISELRGKRRKALNMIEDSGIIEDLTTLKDTIEEYPKVMLHFNEELFSSIIEKILVGHDNVITFQLKGGLSLPISINEVTS